MLAGGGMRSILQPTLICVWVHTDTEKDTWWAQHAGFSDSVQRTHWYQSWFKCIHYSSLLRHQDGIFSMCVDECLCLHQPTNSVLTWNPELPSVAVPENMRNSLKRLVRTRARNDCVSFLWNKGCPGTGALLWYKIGESKIPEGAGILISWILFCIGGVILVVLLRYFSKAFYDSLDIRVCSKKLATGYMHSFSVNLHPVLLIHSSMTKIFSICEIRAFSLGNFIIYYSNFYSDLGR